MWTNINTRRVAVETSALCDRIHPAKTEEIQSKGYRVKAAHAENREAEQRPVPYVRRSRPRYGLLSVCKAELISLNFPGSKVSHYHEMQWRRWFKRVGGGGIHNERLRDRKL